MYNSLNYVLPDEISYSVGNLVSEIHIKYKNPEYPAARAQAFLRLYKTQRYSEWTVDLGGVPFFDSGMEVTVNFEASDIDN